MNDKIIKQNQQNNNKAEMPGKEKSGCLTVCRLFCSLGLRSLEIGHSCPHDLVHEQQIAAQHGGGRDAVSLHDDIVPDALQLRRLSLCTDGQITHVRFEWFACVEVDSHRNAALLTGLH